MIHIVEGREDASPRAGAAWICPQETLAKCPPCAPCWYCAQSPSPLPQRPSRTLPGTELDMSHKCHEGHTTYRNASLRCIILALQAPCQQHETDCQLINRHLKCAHDTCAGRTDSAGASLNHQWQTAWSHTPNALVTQMPAECTCRCRAEERSESRPYCHRKQRRTLVDAAKGAGAYKRPEFQVCEVCFWSAAAPASRRS